MSQITIRRRSTTELHLALTHCRGAQQYVHSSPLSSQTEQTSSMFTSRDFSINLPPTLGNLMLEMDGKMLEYCILHTGETHHHHTCMVMLIQGRRGQGGRRRMHQGQFRGDQGQ